MIKIYKDEKNHITIVFSGKNIPTAATLVHDKGSNRGRNIFGNEIHRYTYHVADAYGDSGHFNSTNDFPIKGKRYKLIRSKQK